MAAAHGRLLTRQSGRVRTHCRGDRKKAYQYPRFTRQYARTTAQSDGASFQITYPSSAYASRRS